MDDELRTERVEETTEEISKCDLCAKKSEPCISFFAHENAMMHKDMDNDRMHKTLKLISEQHSQEIHDISEKHMKDIRNIIIGFFVVILLFVVSYTVRTNIWNDTVRQMNAAIVELANAKEANTP